MSLDGNGTITAVGKLGVVVPTDFQTKAAKVAVKAGFKRNELRLGEKLKYGIRLTDRCMTPGTSEYPRYVPDETWWIFKTTINKIYDALETVGL